MPRRNLSRRSFLHIAASGLTGATLAAAHSPWLRPNAPAQHVLVLLEQGGVSHTDTFDPKPGAPLEHRSPFGPVKTKIPGVHFTELLTKTAQVADKWTIVRCMRQPTPGIGDSHPKGTQYLLSGEAPGGPVEMPDIGSVVASLLSSSCPYLPPTIMVPGNHEQAAMTRVGFLHPRYKVFKTGGRDLSDPGWSVPNLGCLPTSTSAAFATDETC